MENILNFDQIDKNDIGLVGVKGLCLGELTKIGVTVPKGFIITSHAYFSNLNASGAKDRIRSILYNLDQQDPVSLVKCAQLCQNEIKKISPDEKLIEELESAYRELSKSKDKFVAVRTSITAEGLHQAALAGRQTSFLNIKGKANLKKCLLEGWASLFEANAIYYRIQQKRDHFKVGVAIVVQEMVEPEISGVVFTVDPLTGNKQKIIIQSVFGLGEQLVSGFIDPDQYEVDKKTLNISQKKIVVQKKQLVRIHLGSKELPIGKAYQKTQKLPDEKIIELAQIGKKIEKHFFFPQDIEWAYQDGKPYVLQIRALVDIKKVEPGFVTSKTQSKLMPILEGASGSPVIATGTAIVVKTPNELIKVKKGNVLVTHMTSSGFIGAMRKASAVVVNTGGGSSHAAIFSRHLGIACVVGAQRATEVLKTGDVITVDGPKGVVYEGSQLTGHKTVISNPKVVLSKSPVKTATRLYVNLKNQESAQKVAGENIDGVGPLGPEFMLKQIGEHSKKMLLEARGEKYIAKLEQGLSTFCKAFGSRPVIYRVNGSKSNENKSLKGREIYEPDIFKLELEAIIRARRRHKNLHLMAPFVRTPQELKTVRNIIEEYGLFKDGEFKFYMMVEIPANVYMLNEYIDIGIDGISIATNDLTMLISGINKDSSEVADELREMDPAVLLALEKVTKTAGKFNIKSSIYGEAPSADLIRLLVSWGISSISVHPDSIENTRQYIYEAEKKLLNKR